jgi:5-methylcytosine-specific restriction endonuclease McrA
MAVKPCLVCGVLTRGSYCPAHRVPGWTARPSPSSRDRIPKGERDAIKSRDGNVCDRCGEPATGGNRLLVHHVRRVADGGTHTRGNLETICERCSVEHHGRRHDR